jgi:hypothetical protein
MYVPPKIVCLTSGSIKYDSGDYRVYAFDRFKYRSNFRLADEGNAFRSAMLQYASVSDQLNLISESLLGQDEQGLSHQ